MAGIVFYFQPRYMDVHSGHDINLDAWNYTSKICTMVDEIICINQTGNTIGWVDEDFNSTIVESLDFSTLPGTKAQFVTNSDSGLHTMMHAWDHSADWYCFGPAQGWGANLFGDVLIELHQEGSVQLHAEHVAPAVMWSKCHYNMMNR